MARPSKYETEVKDKLTLVQAWARDGLTNDQIAHNLGITEKTLYEWQNKYSEFSEALKRGKEVIDIEVENALLKRALGYRYEEITYEAVEIGENRTPATKIKTVVKEIQPDTTAQIFWLKNRRPDAWRDKQNVEHSGGIDNTITVVFGEPPK
jgi:transposase-like protein